MFSERAYRKTARTQGVNIQGVLPCSDPSYPLVGPGTPHPIGLLEKEMVRLTHSIQSLRINIISVPYPADLLGQFLMHGGATGSLIGAVTALSSLTQSVPPILVGSTLPEHTEGNERICGQIHKYTANGQVIIDTGKYHIRNRLYYPEIRIDMYAALTNGLVASSWREGSQVGGGATLFGALIPMYSLPLPGLFSGMIMAVLGGLTVEEEVGGDWSIKGEVTEYEKGRKPYHLLSKIARKVVDDLRL